MNQLTLSLISQIAANDAVAMERFTNQIGKHVVRWAQRHQNYTRSEATRLWNEVITQLFLTYDRQQRKLESDAFEIWLQKELLSYCITIAKNIVLAERKRQTNYQSLDEQLPIADEALMPLEVFEEDARMERFYQAYAQLKEECRQLFEQKVEQEGHWSKLAIRLGLKEGTIRQQHKRCREKLEEFMSKNNNE